MELDQLSLLSDEERANYYELVRDGALDAAAGAGWRVQGENPYAADWNVNFDWPAVAGTQIGDNYVADSLTAEVAAATLVVAKPSTKKSGSGRFRASTLKRVQLNSSDVRKLREAAKWDKMSEDFPGSPDPFAFGGGDVNTGGVLGQYVPLWPGPVTRQLYWQDYWMMSAKAFEAYNHDPISWRCVHMKAEFALGRGLGLKVTRSKGTSKGQTHDNAQKIFTEYWTRNKMDGRLDTIARDYCWAGEQFLRYFKNGRKLTVRSLDPASIYDLITDPEDIETVFAYHQQFQTPYQLYPPGQTVPSTGIKAPTGASTPGSVTKYVIRQILPQEIDHYKTNASAYERRGRSDLFPALGWIKRLRDYLTSHVIQADMLSRICWDLQVAGNQGAIENLRQKLFPNGNAPPPGTVFGHNSASKLEAIAPHSTGGAASRGDPVLDALVTMVSLSAGLPKDWLGFGLQNTRAGALVATEPASKSLDELQGTLEGVIHDGFNRCMATAGIFDAQLEVSFPSITQEDRNQKLDDLGTMEANGWISKQTAAELAAKEMSITNYSFETEQDMIAQESSDPEFMDHPDKQLLGPDGKSLQVPKQGGRKPRRQVIIATKRQAPKLDITKSPSIEDDPPGLAVPTDGSMPAPGSVDGTGRTVAGGGSHDNGVTRGGAPANENANSNVGKKNIRKDNTNIHESGDTIELTAATLSALLREREPRRRPDDPDFHAAAERFRNEVAGNLHELVNSTKER